MFCDLQVLNAAAAGVSIYLPTLFPSFSLHVFSFLVPWSIVYYINESNSIYSQQKTIIFTLSST